MFERFKSRSRVAGMRRDREENGGGTAVADREDPRRQGAPPQGEAATEVREQDTHHDHHVGRDAAIVGGGAAVAEHEHHKHEREREAVREDDATRVDDTGAQRGRTATGAGAAGTAAVAAEHHHDPAVVRARQREAFGGLSWGAAFFGFLVAVGLAVILLAIASAAGAAFGLSKSAVEGSSGGTITLASGIVLVVILALSYYAGGYVAGRMSRFDGGRQGLGVWVIGLLLTLAAAAAGAILGSKYNVFDSLNLPNIPIDKGTLTTGGAIALGAALLVTILAALGGGKAGERFHRRVDRAGFAE